LPHQLSPGLWVVATPIGNLGDMTGRARDALSRANAVLCEDTRRSAKLMAALGITPRLERFDAHASDREMERWVERLQGGESLALITDAGTPAVSDPGSRLVALARANGVAVVPVPGVSSVATLLSVAGFDETAFVFRGYFPRKPGERVAELKSLAPATAARIAVWFESPHRIVEALKEVAAEVPDSQVFAAKELTKVHERFFSGSAGEVSELVRAHVEEEGTLGEWSFAVLFPVPENRLNSSDWVKALQCILDCRIPASEAAKRVSQHFGAPKNQVYEKALELSGKKS
jgi:16S rRNA (cytidine1402-2'-O)-methyltransferase